MIAPDFFGDHYQPPPKPSTASPNVLCIYINSNRKCVNINKYSYPATRCAPIFFQACAARGFCTSSMCTKTSKSNSHLQRLEPHMKRTVLETGQVPWTFKFEQHMSTSHASCAGGPLSDLQLGHASALRPGLRVRQPGRGGTAVGRADRSPGQ